MRDINDMADLRNICKLHKMLGNALGKIGVACMLRMAESPFPDVDICSRSFKRCSFVALF